MQVLHQPKAPQINRPLEGRTALVTGGARRLGRAISITLADAGADVLVQYRTAGADVDELVDALRSRGARASAINADFSKPGAPEKLLTAANTTLANPPDILVNNASSFPKKTWTQATEQDLLESLRVNAWAPLDLIREFAKRTDKGTAINVLDARLFDPDPLRLTYSLAKHMLAQVTHIAARELAPRIRVNAIAPGPVLAPVDAPHLDVQRLRRHLPLPDAPTPEDVAAAVVFLTQANSTTGHTLYVDGGLHLLGATQS